MYTQCLRKLGRIEDDVQVSLKLLARLVQRDQRAPGPGKRLPEVTLNKYVQSTTGKSKVLRDLLSNSKNLSTPVRVPIDRYFEDATLSPYLRHLQNHGEFELDLAMCQDMTNVLDINEIKVKLTSVAETTVSEIWLQSRGITRLQRGKSTVPLVSSVRNVPRLLSIFTNLSRLLYRGGIERRRLSFHVRTCNFSMNHLQRLKVGFSMGAKKHCSPTQLKLRVN